jgi:hypothetical protein
MCIAIVMVKKRVAKWGDLACSRVDTFALVLYVYIHKRKQERSRGRQTKLKKHDYVGTIFHRPDFLQQRSAREIGLIISGVIAAMALIVLAPPFLQERRQIT